MGYTEEQIKQMMFDRIFTIVQKYADCRNASLKEVRRDINAAIDEIYFFT